MTVLMRLLRDRRLWIVLGVVALLVALRLSPVGHLLSPAALAAHHDELAMAVARNALLAGAAFVALYVAVVAFSLPGATIMTLAGGLLFGGVLGTALTVVAATIGATIVFLLAQRLFGEDALDRLGPRAHHLAEGIRRDAVSYLLVLRLVPIFPFVLVNLVPAFCGVRLPVFVATTLFGILPGTAVYTLAGAGLAATLAAGGEFEIGRVLTVEMLAALLGLAALSLAAIPLRHRFARH
jgi:uncharacterized membrane protein YdjX (TVP38/TMEM64 family)